MIFKTITDPIGGKTTLGTNFKNIGNNFNNIKNFFGKQSLLSDSDINAIKAYNSQIDACVTSQTAFRRTMLDASESAQILVANANGATVQIENLTRTSKAGQIALKGLAIAGNMITFALIAKGIQLVTQKMSDLAHASEITSEKAKGLSSSISSYFKDISSNSSTLTGLNDEYKKLSEGVNNLGENVSLSSDEYLRYKEVIGQISSIMPNMTTYFNAQGEKIAFAKGNLKDLNKEYQKYLQNQAIKFIVEGDEDGNKPQDIIDDFNNTKHQGIFEGAAKNLKEMFGQYDVKDLPAQTMLKAFEDIQNKSRKEISDYFNALDFSDDGQYLRTEKNQSKKILSKILGIPSGDELLKMSDQDFHTLQENISANVENLKTTISSKMNNVQTMLLTYVQGTNEFWTKLDEDQQKNVTLLFSSIGSEAWNGLNKQTELEVQGFVNRIINDFSSNKDGFATAWKELFSLETEDLPVEEYVQKVRELILTIANTLGLDKKGISELKFNLGFGDTDRLERQYKKAIKKAQKKFNADETEFFTENSINTEEEIAKWEEIAKSCNSAIEAEKKYLKQLKKIENTKHADKLKNLWNSSDEEIKKAREEIEKLEGSYLTVEDIANLSSNAIVSSMENIGMSSEFIAGTLTNVGQVGESAFDLITKKTLELDRELSGMNKKLSETDNALSQYQKEMQSNDYNAQYLEYKKAQEDAMKMFQNNEYGDHFWSTMQLLFGDNAYTKSINELKEATKQLGNYFSDNAVHAQTFFDKIISLQNSGALDGLGVSIKKLTDGSYDWDIPEEAFASIAEQTGYTEELITALVNSLGMLGSFSNASDETLKKIAKTFGVVSKDSDKTTVSLQGLVTALKAMGRGGNEIQTIIKDLDSMDSVKVIDFSVTGKKDIESIVNELESLNLIELDGKKIKLDSFIKTLKNKLHVADDEIRKYTENFSQYYTFTNSDGKKITNLDDKVNKLLGGKGKDGTKKQIDETKKSTDKLTKSTEKSKNALENLNQVSFNGLYAGLDTLIGKMKTAKSEADKVNSALNNNPIPSKNYSDTSNSPNFPAVNPSDFMNPLATKKANVSGTFNKLWTKYRHSKHAYASGDWSLNQNEEALINELGQESIVRDGHWMLVPGGAHFQQLKKGDIIFNHVQTKELLQNGQITSGNGHGKVAYSTGTAFNMLKESKPAYPNGTIPSNVISSQTHSNTTKEKKNSSNKNSTNKSKKDFKELFNWIEILIKRTERLAKKAIDNVERYASSSKKKDFAKKAIKEQLKLIKYNSSGAEKYKKKANSISGLDEKYKNKVRNGTLDISTIKDEKLAEKIKEYQDWYEKFLDCKDAASEAKDTLKEYAETLASIPWEKASKEVERLNDWNEVLDKQLSNKTALKSKNNILAEQLELSQKILKVQQQAVKEEEKQQTELKNSILKSKDYKKLDNNSKNQIKTSLSKGNKISLSKVKGVSDNSKLYGDMISYNANVDVHDNSLLELEKQKQDTISSVKEKAKSIVDNVWDEAMEKVENLNNKIESLDKVLANTDGFKARNKIIEEQIELLNKMVEISKQAVQDEKKKSNLYNKNIGKELAKDDKRKKKQVTSKEKKAINDALKNKEKINLKDLPSIKKDSDLYKDINKWNASIDKIAEGRQIYQDKKQEIISEINQKTLEKYSNIQNTYEQKINQLQAQADKLNGLIDLAETKGQEIGSAYYTQLTKLQKSETKKLEKEKEQLEKQLESDIKSGRIKIDSDKWYEAIATIQDCEKEILNSKNATEQFNNSLRELEWGKFDKLLSKLEEISKESNFLIGLFDKDNMFDDNGNINLDGLTAQGLYAQNHNVYMEESKKYAEEIKKIDESLAKDPYNKSLLDRRNELLSAQQQAITNAKSEKDSIISLVEEGYKKKVDALSKLVSKQQELLDKEKELHDYEKSIRNKSDNITMLEKQIQALSLSTDRADIAKRLQLEEELKNSKEDLEEEQYQHSISSQKDALSNALDDYKEQIDDYLKDRDKVFEDALTEVNAYHSSILTNIENKAQSVGYKISDSLIHVWSNTNPVSTYTNTVIDSMNGVGEALDNVITKLQDMYQYYEKIAKESINTTFKDSDNLTTSAKIRNILGEASGKNGASNKGTSELNKYLASLGYASLDQDGMVNLAKALNIKGMDSIEGIRENGGTSVIVDELKKYLSENKSTTSEIEKQGKVSASNVKKTMDLIHSASTYKDKRDKLSDLNKYIYDNYSKKYLTKSQMVKLAKYLGETSIKNTSDLTDKAKKKLLDKLKAASFSKGGIVEFVRQTGEDGISLVRRGEGILSQEQVKLFQKSIPIMNHITQQLDINKNRVPVQKEVSNIVKITSPLVEVNGNLDNVTKKELEIAIGNVPNMLVSQMNKYGSRCRNLKR